MGFGAKNTVQAPDATFAFQNKKVLITGGLGFIGSNLARRLVQLGAKIVLVDSMIPEYGGNLFNIDGIEGQVQINLADVRDEHGMRALIRGQDYLFNLAGQTSHLDSMEDPYTDLEINCRSQLYILEACRRHNPGIRIVYASTRQIYGAPDYFPVDENHPLRPVDVNGINKMAGEYYHILYQRIYGMQISVLRLTNTYGPRMRVRDARQTFLGIWIRRLIDGMPIEVFGDGLQKRDFNYVDDVVEAFLLCASRQSSNGKVFNLGDIDPITLIDLAKMLIQLNEAGEFRLIAFPPARKAIDIGDYYADYTSIQSTLGWSPRTRLREGLKETLEFYRKYKSHYWELSHETCVASPAGQS